MSEPLLSPSCCQKTRLLTRGAYRLVGAKTHKTSELVRVVEKSGKSYTVKGEVGLSGLSPESRQYVELSDEGHSMCLALEAAITAEEQRSTNNVPFFPITIGRWENAASDVG